ncbi:MAG: ABC transporter substrate-binding protein [Gammaproteobacteria bacterium]|nr:ABC transporter substrate-binding protein [Gammaproteobacteria bacterium]
MIKAVFFTVMLGLGVAHAAPMTSFDTPTGTMTAPVVARSTPPPEIVLPAGRPDALLRDGFQKLTQFLSTESAVDPKAIRAYLGQEVAQYFDFDVMGRWAAGPFYQKLNSEQKAQFATKLQGLFLDGLARNLGSYSRPLPKTQIYPFGKSRRANLMTVRARVMPNRAYPVNVDFRFAARDGEWKVYDVSANGFSAVAFYRQHFASRARSKGISAFYE